MEIHLYQMIAAVSSLLTMKDTMRLFPKKSKLCCMKTRQIFERGSFIENKNMTDMLTNLRPIYAVNSSNILNKQKSGNMLFRVFHDACFHRKRSKYL